MEAAKANKVYARINPGNTYYSLNLDGGKYWIGISFTEPEKLWFSTRCRINAEAAAGLGVGELLEESWVPGRHLWRREVELDSEEVHFFSRTKVSQIQWLEAFLRDCLAKARSIETPDQPPIPEQPEGN
jgi:hypothetical protein